MLQRAISQIVENYVMHIIYNREKTQDLILNWVFLVSANTLSFK